MSGKVVTVLGAGYVGLTTATLLAQSGHKVYLIEPNEDRLKVIQSGKSFFYEGGLNPLIEEVTKNGKMVATNSYAESIPNSDFIFSCVGTPDNPDGSSNLSYVKSAAEQASKYISREAIYVQKSTVPVGTGIWVKDLLPREVTYASNPEFLREGTALHDTLCFDRVVVGSDDPKEADKIIDLYKSIQANKESIAKRAGISINHSSGEYIVTGVSSAELIKVTANAFLALKISFANSIAKLADHAGADVTEVMDAVGSDKRIGRAFLNTGRGYGGGCFPKDVSGLIRSAEEHGVDLPIMDAVTAVNDSMPGYIVNKTKKYLGGDLQGKKVAVLGLAFKAGTSDSRRSPAVNLANLFTSHGAETCAYDPKATKEKIADLKGDVIVCDDISNAVQHADTVVIATDWEEFKNIDLKSLSVSMNGNVLIDAMNCMNASDVINSGLQYVGIGRGKIYT